MKNLFTISLFAFILFLVSCTDPCENITCENEGFCEEGTCICEAEYEGENCETEIRTKFYGKYRGSFKCENQDSVKLDFTLRKGIDVNKINFFNTTNPAALSETMVLNGNVWETIINQEIDGNTFTTIFQFTFLSTDEIDFKAIYTLNETKLYCPGSLQRYE
jgi:hypothetical protein